MNSSSEIKLLLKSIDEGYVRKAWHGPNLRGSIRGLSVKDASWRPGKNRHNIWEIVVHCAYWKYVVRRRITGERRGSFPLKGSNWFTRPEGNTSEGRWRKDISLLEDMHRLLYDAVKELSLLQLEEISHGGRNVTNRSIIIGIAMHDVYHAGQIQLLKRFLPQRK